MNYLCLCILSTFLFANIGKIERKSHKDHTADYVADCNEQQRFTARKICKILTLLCRNTVKLLSFCNIFGIHCRHNTCRNIEHICNAVFKSADYECTNRKKYAKILPIASVAPVAITIARHTRMLQSMPLIIAVAGLIVVLASATLIVKAPSPPFE